MGDYVNECKGYEWITKDTFEGHTQDITLTVRIKDGKTINRIGQLLPCDLDELRSESTSLDPYGYTWEAPENCILSVLKEAYAQMLENDHLYYIVSQNNSDAKYLFDVKMLLNIFLTNQQKITLLHTIQSTLQFTMVDLIRK